MNFAPGVGGTYYSCRPPVVLVHGIDDTGQKLAEFDRFLSERGWAHRVRFDMSPNDGTASLTMLSAQVADAVDRTLLQTGASKVDLVAFSMGAIISRHYLQRRGGMEKVRRFLSLSGPHHGTLTGYLRWNPGAIELRPGSMLLQDLDRDVASMSANVQCYSFYTPFDLMIFPANSSKVPWAKNVVFPVLLHPQMVADRRVLEFVAATLAESCP